MRRHENKGSHMTGPQRNISTMVRCQGVPGSDGTSQEGLDHDCVEKQTSTLEELLLQGEELCLS